MFAVDEILPESFLALFKKIYFLVMTHVELGGGEGPPTPTPHQVYAQTCTYKLMVITLSMW